MDELERAIGEITARRPSMPRPAPRRLVWSRAARARLERHLIAALPAEGCGLLGGHREGDAVVATAFLPLANVLAARDRFRIDPLAFLRAAAALADDGRPWLGFAHSHPGGTTAPSRMDAASLWRGCLQVIAAPSGPASCPLAAYWPHPGNPPRAFCALAVQDGPP